MSNTLVDSKLRLLREDASQWHTNADRLALYAAFPIGLTVDMLYQLWHNFKTDDSLVIPMIAVSDLLLSPLFKTVGNGIYEMDESVRTALLEQLHSENAEILPDLAAFTQQYAKEQLIGEHYNSFRETLIWNANATLDPLSTVKALSKRLQESIKNNNNSEIFRLRELIERFAIQEKGINDMSNSVFNPLLQFSVALKGAAINANPTQIQQKIEGLGLQVSEIPIPNAEMVQLPSSLVKKGVLNKLKAKRPRKPKTANDLPAIYPMLVGINEYKNNIITLKGCINDNELLENYLKSHYPNQLQVVKKLQNEQATKLNIFEQFQFLVRNADENDYIFFAFSGYDSVEIIKRTDSYDKEVGFLLLYDSLQKDNTYSETIYGKEFLDIVEQNPKLNFVFWMDLCYAYCFFPYTPDNMVALISDSIGQKSWEMTFNDIQYGNFTYNLVKILEENKEISYSEAIKLLNEKLNPKENFQS